MTSDSVIVFNSLKTNGFPFEEIISYFKRFFAKFLFKTYLNFNQIYKNLSYYRFARLTTKAEQTYPSSQSIYFRAQVMHRN